jgi:hypothetical protein
MQVRELSPLEEKSRHLFLPFPFPFPIDISIFDSILLWIDPPLPAL